MRAIFNARMPITSQIRCESASTSVRLAMRRRPHCWHRAIACTITLPVPPTAASSPVAAASLSEIVSILPSRLIDHSRLHRPPL